MMSGSYTRKRKGKNSMCKTPGGSMFKELKEGHRNGTADDQRESDIR